MLRGQLLTMLLLSVKVATGGWLNWRLAYWLLAAGYWLLATGGWLLAVGGFG